MADKFLKEEIICVRREIAMRERVYPGWVASGRMKAHNAEYEIATMKRLLARLNKMADEEENQERVDNGQFGVGA